MDKKSENIFDEATRIAGAYRAGVAPDPIEVSPVAHRDAEGYYVHASSCALFTEVGTCNCRPPFSSAERKTYPMCTGLLDYFPDACAEVAHVSYVGNEQHHPGEPLHWDRSKSMDQADCLLRHLKDRGKRDTDGERHTAKVAWRALALLQLEIEKDRDNEC